MISKIIKRDGSFESFQPVKIERAILKAGKETGEFSSEVASSIAKVVISKLERKFRDKSPMVEEIQDIVERVLMSSRYKKTAKAYIIYREQHKKIRDIANSLNSELIDSYINLRDWKVNENSNMSYSLQGLNNYITSEVSKSYWLESIYPKRIKDAHETGDIHIHDLSTLSVYCVGWDLSDLLLSGFGGVDGKISSKPPKHFRTALGQIVNFFYTLQGEAAGAQAFSNFDTLLSPFVFYDGLNYKDIKQALQEFLFNVNVPTRVGFQTPFTNITFDIKVPDYLKLQPVIVGGKLMDKVYGDFQKEMNLINEAFLDLMIEGDAVGRVFTFPIPTYNITKDFDWESKVARKIFELSAKYGVPYFSNFISSDMKPDDARSMCCRLRIDNRKLEKKIGNFGASPLTGSIGIVTINLPRIGIESKNEKDFFDILDERLYISKESLEIKRSTLEKLTDAELYPYSSFYLRNIKERFGKFWKNHFSTIGIVGMNEAIKNMTKGEENITSKKGIEFSLNVLRRIKERLVEFQLETGENYNLEATPAEATSFRLALLDKERFGNVCYFGNREGLEESLPEFPFYTNSTQLPVNFTDDVFLALDLQNDLQSEYTGGTVFHIFLGERVSNPESVGVIVRKVCENYKIPYFTITPTFSICKNHGYINGEKETCDKCGSECEVYSRVVGYLRPVKNWNYGKKEEFRKRVNFKI
mgnify:CR=1 FL=1